LPFGATCRTVSVISPLSLFTHRRRTIYVGVSEPFCFVAVSQPTFVHHHHHLSVCQIGVVAHRNHFVIGLPTFYAPKAFAVFHRKKEQRRAILISRA